MQTFLLIVQVLISISLIALILLQHGKGADAGAAFGSGASATVFGASGSSNFLSRTTGILATLFFAVSLSLSVMAHRQTEEKNLIEKYNTQTEQADKAVEKIEGAVPEVPVSDVPAAPGSDVPKAPATDVPAASGSDVPAVPTAESQAPVPAAESKPAESKKEQ